MTENVKQIEARELGKVNWMEDTWELLYAIDNDPDDVTPDHPFYNMHIPDTVVFKYQRPSAWFHTSAGEGFHFEKRAKAKDLSALEIIRRLRKVHASRSNTDIVAYYVYPKREANGAENTIIEYFDDASVEDFLFNRKKDNNGLLQAFVDSSSDNHTVLRTLWTPHWFQVEARRNITKHRVSNKVRSQLTKEDKAVTFDGPEHKSETIEIKSPQINSRLNRIVSGINRSISLQLPHKHSIKQLVTYFKIDSRGHIWLLWCFPVRVVPDAAKAQLKSFPPRPMSPRMAEMKQRSLRGALAKGYFSCPHCSRVFIDAQKCQVAFRCILLYYGSKAVQQTSEEPPEDVPELLNWLAGEGRAHTPWKDMALPLAGRPTVSPFPSRSPTPVQPSSSVGGRPSSAASFVSLPQTHRGGSNGMTVAGIVVAPPISQAGRGEPLSTNAAMFSSANTSTQIQLAREQQREAEAQAEASRRLKDRHRERDTRTGLEAGEEAAEKEKAMFDKEGNEALLLEHIVNVANGTASAQVYENLKTLCRKRSFLRRCAEVCEDCCLLFSESGMSRTDNVWKFQQVCATHTDKKQGTQETTLPHNEISLEAEMQRCLGITTTLGSTTNTVTTQPKEQSDHSEASFSAMSLSEMGVDFAPRRLHPQRALLSKGASFSAALDTLQLSDFQNYTRSTTAAAARLRVAPVHAETSSSSSLHENSVEYSGSLAGLGSSHDLSREGVTASAAHGRRSTTTMKGGVPHYALGTVTSSGIDPFVSTAARSAYQASATSPAKAARVGMYTYQAASPARAGY